MGLLVEFGEIYHPSINNAVLAFDQAFAAGRPTGVIECVPTFRSVLIRFDPIELEYETLEGHVAHLLDNNDWYGSDAPSGRKHWILPTVYGGARGKDLGEVADLMNMREDQVVDSHAEASLTVAMLGFSPGLAYLGQLPDVWQFSRRTKVTPSVPAGAVLVAVRQVVLPCTPIPTGWRQIGQTPFRSFDVSAKKPFLLSPGDQVQFEPVSETAFQAFEMSDFLRTSPP